MAPIDMEAWYMLGMANEQLGIYDEAESCFRKAAAIQPNRPENHYNLAKMLELQGNIAEALNSYREAVRLKPDFAAAYTNMGVMLENQGSLEEALEAHSKAARLAPELAEAHFNLGGVLQKMKRYEEAAASYHAVLRLRPDFAEVYNNLGSCHYAQGAVEMAIEKYRQAVRVKPDYADAYNNLGNALKEQGNADHAVQCYRHAIALNPASAAAYHNLGDLLRLQGNLEAAEKMIGHALKLQPDFAEAQVTLGAVYILQGKTDAAVGAYQSVIRCAPEHVVAHSNLLMTMHYRPEYSSDDLLKAAQGWAAQHSPSERCLPPPANLPDPQRRLRIGYVSADLHNHPVGFFIESVFAHHDSSRHETFCYYNAKVNDDLTKRLRQSVHHWRDIAGQQDEPVAWQIRQDGIDLLIDLSGHTDKNRLLMFAHKPAPVQALWIGYHATTGLPAMDYIIADRCLIPPQEERYYVEQVVRLPNAYLCFSPPDYVIEPSPLPALATGKLTFGCFNNTAKLTEAVVACWSKLLCALPEAQLFLKHKAFGDAGVRQRYQELFAQRGIAADRIRFAGHSHRAEYLAAYQEVDIGLDPFPFNGCTTMVEALWMGVPMVSLRGDRYAGHMGETILQNIGLGECVADSEEAYISKAIALASDLSHLAGMRQQLRAQLLNSPLCDGAGFTRDLETTYRTMWETWCGPSGTPFCADRR